MQLVKEKKDNIINTKSNTVQATQAMHNSMKQITDKGIFNFSGIEEVKHTFFGAVPHVTDKIRKNYLEEVEKVVKENL